MHLCRMVLQMHFARQCDVGPWMGARDWMIVKMVAEMLAMEVLLEVAGSRESLQAITGR